MRFENGEFKQAKNEPTTTSMVVDMIIVGIIGWAVIEGLIWLLSHVEITIR